MRIVSSLFRLTHSTGLVIIILKVFLLLQNVNALVDVGSQCKVLWGR